MGRELRLRRGLEAGPEASGPYAEIVGSLMYLMTCTIPDIAQAVGVLSRYISDPRQQHWDAAKRLLCYVAGTVDYGLNLCQKRVSIFTYCYADFAGHIETRKSTTAYTEPYCAYTEPICVTTIQA
jgi:hypothetical protein